MVTEHATAPAASAASKPDQNSLVCYFQGGYAALGDARVPIMTHAFLYGTAVFEGIRAYWNPDEKQLYALRVKEHIVRLRNSSKIMLMSELPSVQEFTDIVVQVLRRNNFKEDAYCRPSVYKNTEAIGVRLHGLTHDFYVLAIPMGDYIDTEKGIATGTVSWRRTSDVSIPSRSKITGSYVNPAFSKSEAMLNGFDEAIVLTADGHVAEGSAENLFMIRDGVLITPSVSEDILEGITRAGIIEIAAYLGLPVRERQIDRSELYIADEVFLCGTGAQVSPVASVDHRPVGDGRVGPISRQISKTYFDAVRGRLPAFRHWVIPVYTGE
ncbi:MAG: branched-chain amino acid transaminase [Candidatus Limnocylindrales bacterium]|jgi:branched-chain amino acid aminotransferase